MAKNYTKQRYFMRYYYFLPTPKEKARLYRLRPTTVLPKKITNPKISLNQDLFLKWLHLHICCCTPEPLQRTILKVLQPQCAHYNLGYINSQTKQESFSCAPSTECCAKGPRCKQDCTDNTLRNIICEAHLTIGASTSRQVLIIGN